MIDDAIVLDRHLSLADVERVADGAARISLSPFAMSRMAAAHQRLDRCVAERRVVYGVTTGFGPLADRLVAPDDIISLQRNLIYHLASGVGRPLSWRAARAVTAARLSALAQGWSGASRGLAERLVAVLNSDLAPEIPEKGTVGASGDLTPLAHLALALMGEGAFLERDGTRAAPATVFARLGFGPLTLEARDGLALVNGASAMTGIAALNSRAAHRLWRWSAALTGLQAELLAGRTEAWRAEFAEARPHPGQAQAAAALRARVAGSSRADGALAADRVLPEEAEPSQPARDGRPVQDPYTLRCAPQVLGAVWDVAAFHDQVIERELNAATDNPLFAADAPYALHGGNFMGQHAAFASDALANGVIMLAVTAERRVARLTDEARNGGLPAFLTGGESGLHSGFMGAQVTATALVAEMRARAMPASIQSISTNGDNQDVVSMGTIAARKTSDLLAEAFHVLAIEALCVVQAMDLRLAEAQDADGFSPAAHGLRDWVRARSPFLGADRPLSAEIQALADMLASGEAPAGAPKSSQDDAEAEAASA